MASISVGDTAATAVSKILHLQIRRAKECWQQFVFALKHPSIFSFVFRGSNLLSESQTADTSARLLRAAASKNADSIACLQRRKRRPPLNNEQLVLLSSTRSNASLAGPIVDRRCPRARAHSWPFDWRVVVCALNIWQDAARRKKTAAKRQRRAASRALILLAR